MCSRTAKCTRVACWRECARGPCCSSIWATVASSGSTSRRRAPRGRCVACVRRRVTRVVHTFYESDEVFDGLVWLGNHQAQAGAVVRLVRVRGGCSTHAYLSNVLDPSVLSVGDLLRLYARRWDSELAFLLLKEDVELHLGGHSKLTGILQQIWARLIIAQLLQAMRMEIACQAHVDPFEVSMPLVVRSMPLLLAREQDPIAVCVQRGRQLGFIRPSSRLQLQVPAIASPDIVPRPADLVLERTPCYPADPGRPGRKSSNSRHKPKTGLPNWLGPDMYEFIAQQRQRRPLPSQGTLAESPLPPLLCMPRG